MDTTPPTPSTPPPEAGLPTDGTTGPPHPASVSTAEESTHQAADDASLATGGAVSEDQVKLALRRVKDPDLNLNIVDLGLMYGLRVDGHTVHVDITLTSPACPSGPEIIAGVEREVQLLPGVEEVQVNLIWTPFWTPDRIEPRVRAYLGL